MALVLVRLKLAIQRRALGGSGAAHLVFYVLGWLLAVGTGWAVGHVVAGGDIVGSRDGEDLALLAVLTVVFLTWLLGPLLFPTFVDQTVDPERLEQFPITPGEQVLGLLLGGLIAPTAAFTFLVAAGGTFAPGATIGTRLFTAGSALVFVVLCVATSRVVQSALADATRSRRGRDLLVAASGVVAVVVLLVSQAAEHASHRVRGSGWSTVADILGWLPPGAVGRATLQAQDGDWSQAALHLAVALLTLLLALAAWRALVARRAVGRSAGRPRHDRAVRSSARTRLLPPALAAFPPSALLASASQQVRYLCFRVPSAAQAVALYPVVGVIAAHSIAAGGDLIAGALVFAVLALIPVCTNLLGFDDRGFGYLLAAGAPWRPVIRGKALAPVVLSVPLVGAFVAVESVLNRTWEDSVAAWLGGISIVLAGAGLGAIASVHAPLNQVRRRVRFRGVAIVNSLGATFTLLVMIGVLALVVDSTPDPWLRTAIAAATFLPSVVIFLVATGAAGRTLAKDPWKAAASLGV